MQPIDNSREQNLMLTRNSSGVTNPYLNEPGARKNFKGFPAAFVQY